MVDPVPLNRRVESLDVVDDDIVRRRVRLDFTVPSTGMPAGAPLIVIGTNAVQGLDLRDEDGRAIPFDLHEGRVVADLQTKPDERRVLELTYEEPLEPERGTLARLGIAPATLRFGFLCTHHAGALHLELEVPDGLLIVGAQLVGPAEHESTPLGGRRVHLTCDGTAWEAVARVRADRHGFLSSALLLCLVTFALLSVGRLRLTTLFDRVGEIGPVLLIVPALLTAFLVRPSEHALTGLVLKPTRYALTASGVLAVAGAAVLVVGAPKDDVELIGIILACAAGFAALIPLVTWAVAKRG